MNTQVVIVQRILPHYRVSFFTGLHERLRASGIQLRVLYGKEREGTVPRTVTVDAPWAEFVDNRYFWFKGKELVWQGGVIGAVHADLVILEQANRLLANHLVMALSRVSGARVAFWGHGRNLQEMRSGTLSERLKGFMRTRVDWWFAYTTMSAEIVRASGYPADRITVVNNSIDTAAFERALNAVTEEDIAALRSRLGISGEAIALYCGGLYSDKRIPFLLVAVEAIRASLGEFDFIVIGDGPDASKVKKAAERHSWIHYVGPVFGDERAVYFRAADVMLMPGLVGLAIVDCFLAGVPLITTDIPIHSPEIAYLEAGRNGIMTTSDAGAYANAVVELLRDRSRLARLTQGCLESAKVYALDNMVESFARGVEACLGSDKP